MERLEILAFTDEHLDDAALLLAERHARHRAAERLLPEIENFRDHVEREWRSEGQAVRSRSRGVMSWAT